MHPSKRKGDKAELEVQTILRDLTGLPIRRALGAGRLDDKGDIEGLTDCVVQVVNRQDIATAIREKLPEAERQRQTAGASFAAVFVRRPGGAYVVCMSPEQFVALWREAA